MLKLDAIKDSIQRILKQPKEITLVKLADRITNFQKPGSWTTKKTLNYYTDGLFIAYEPKGHYAYLGTRIAE